MSTLKLSSIVLVSVSLLAIGCDDPEQAQGKCESLVQSYCDRYVSCGNQAGGFNDNFTAEDLRDECTEFMLGNAHCEDAVRVSKEFGSCMNDARSLSCDVIDDSISSSSSLDERYIAPLPNDCQGAVLYND
jgi:hypothetical protein